ncbi:hypothetical protein M407DRAFT_18748 [Tulasnella calospora MUT 4182]|uniref:Uncharacterized protein n=1 Tax=Tulasnella calospora MUT 4182 TaxID=1051891 RepID=A0A0C3MEH6_9AGAM|nr:hypothetical protein M407DRAFT_18748 [Tulasnella calospora MUT 4182]
MPDSFFGPASYSTSYASSEVPQTDPTPPRDAGAGNSADHPVQTNSSVAPSGPRRSTRQPGLVKNPYIVREANNLKAARNRIYALIDASEEAQKAADTTKTLREAAATGDTMLSSAVLTQRLLAGAASRSRSATPARGRPAKRRRGVMEAEERYEHAYGYGDKDGDDIDLEKELQKEYDEIVGKLWVEGPATTGAVISYLKARRKLLQVVDLVREWEAYKVEHNIPDTEIPGPVKAIRQKPTRAETPTRRSLRARVPAARTVPQSDTEGAPRRKHRKTEHPSATSGIAGSSNTPNKPSGLSQSFSVASLPERKPSSTRSISTFGSNSSLSELSSSESQDGNAGPPVDPTVQLVTGVASPLSPLQPLPPPAPKVLPTIRLRDRQATRQVKTADNSPAPETKPLPDELQKSVPPLKLTRSLVIKSSSSPQNQRASSHPAPGASEATEKPRVLRSRSKLNLPSKFDGFVSTVQT